ncbi:hypothetical protein SLA2020_074750 [Shorea laevis]
MLKVLGSETICPHIALFPSAGMGHLTPFLRLASVLLSNNCKVTLITPTPSVSVAESTHISSFVSAHPEVNHLEFQLPSIQPPPNSITKDPFHIHFNTILRSVHLLHPLLCSLSPPPSAIFSDILVAAGVIPVAVDLGLPHYTLVTFSAIYLSLTAYISIMVSDPTRLKCSTEIEIPGLGPVPVGSIPPPYFNPNHLFTSVFLSNARALPEVDGILINSFDWLEPETLSALNSGNVFANFPPVFPIGPLVPYELKRKEECHYLQWLDIQPKESVVYVSFGSRTATSKDQMKELRDCLWNSKYRFLWILKSNNVDKDDKEDLDTLLGHSFFEDTKDRGIVVKPWVYQQEILAHPAVGGFVSHCGWNSITEAARNGVPVLAWPHHADQSVNAEVVKKAGLGLWDSSWGWGLQNLVKQEEIQKMIGELMENQKLRITAKKVGDEAKKAGEIAGSSNKVLMKVLRGLVE